MERILVIKLSSLGDVLHAMPAVHALAKRSGARIDWVTQPEYQNLVACCPDVDQIVLFPRHQFFRHWRPFCESLRRENYDAIVDFQGLFKSALAAKMAKGTHRFGPARTREGAHFFYNAQPTPHLSRPHAIEELMDIADLVIPSSEPRRVEFDLRLPAADLPCQAPYIVFVPFSRWLTKDWPATHFAELGKRLHQETGAPIWIAGGREDISRGQHLASMIGEGAICGCGTTSIPQLGSILKQAKLVVSVDSGPMHLAAAVGTPVVSIFGATNPNWTGPYGQLHRVVSASDCAACRPCHSRTCQLGSLKCLDQIPVEAVYQMAISTWST